MSDSSESSFSFLINWKFGLAVSVPCFAVGLGVTWYYYFKTLSNTELLDKLAVTTSIAKKDNVQKPPETNKIYQKAVQTKTLLEGIESIKKVGNIEFSKGNYDVAITYYTHAILMCPRAEEIVLSILFQNRAAAYNKLVGKLMTLNNNENCLADCNKALALVPTYKKALSRRARVLSELGNFKLALEDITAVQMFDEYKNQDDLIFADSVTSSLAKQNMEEYIKGNPLNLPSKTFIDNYLKSFCDVPFSDEFALTLLKSDINTGLEYALKCIQNQKYENIENACQEELKKTDNSLIRRSLALNLLATFCILRGNIVAGIEHLTTVIENLNVPNKLIINSLIKRAIGYHQQEEVDKCFEDFKRAEAIDPNSSVIYHHRAQIYLDEMYTEKAVEDFKKSMELNPKIVLYIVQYYFAQYRHAKKVSNELDIEKFLGKLKGFVIKYPNIVNSYTFYAQALSEKGAYEEADLLLKKGTEIHPNNASFLILRALNLLSWKNSIPDAFNLLEQALNIDPKYLHAYKTLGLLNMRIEKLKEAVDYWEKAIPLSKSEKELLKIFSVRDSVLAQLAVVERFEITLPEPREDDDQNPGPSTLQNISRPECFDTNEQHKGKIKKLEKLTNVFKTKKRKYDEFYLKLGFTWTGSLDEPNLQCVVCSKILSNNSVKQSFLKRHLESKHTNLVNEELQYFERLLEDLKNMKNCIKQFSAAEQNEKALKAS
ncbi:Tetratricopeptide repeat,Tetratricopeptide repeat-containing domain,Tetratricopeptide-like helical [Cinara cedri]|uniref:Tetratricopeptide repeat,Tetratricopeptide repeat-containing domain,Tetratricopeptide-like helical n=1 Tax=Cinara cedri TaxID=506608 RepID=A0A5E4M8G7_9HEMI|nr:Tetratricopeptide repeat,Tetratricopeptide repeat-containing domain,Tetratricopeptide-like helical [Cinara cedri]